MGGKRIFRLLIHTPLQWSVLGQAEGRSFVWLSCGGGGGRDPNSRPSFASFSRLLVGSWIGNKAAGAQTGAHMKCWLGLHAAFLCAGTNICSSTLCSFVLSTTSDYLMPMRLHIATVLNLLLLPGQFKVFQFNLSLRISEFYSVLSIFKIFLFSFNILYSQISHFVLCVKSHFEVLFSFVRFDVELYILLCTAFSCFALCSFHLVICDQPFFLSIRFRVQYFSSLYLFLLFDTSVQIS